MKKLLLIIMMLSMITSYSQSKKFNCYCPPKKAVHHKKYIVKKAPKAPIVVPKEPCVIVCPPEKVEIKTIETKVIETRVIKKEVVYIEPPVLRTTGPILELYTGYVEAKNSNLKYSYLIGGNIYINLFQTQRNGPQQRVYANKALFGFEHSALISNEVNIIQPASIVPDDIENCNCTEQSIGLQDKEQINTFKHKVRAVSLNVGIEVYKGWYLLTGITNYQHIFTLNTLEYNEYRTLYIDAGVQKVFKLNRWFFIPKFKFNPETTTFAIGVSYR